MAKVSVDKLKALSKEEKLKLYDLIQKKKEIARQQRDLFTPHPGQLKVVMCDKPIRVVTAGNGFGKTALAVNTALHACLGYNPWRKEYTPVPCVGAVVVDNPIKIKETWLKEFAKWYNMDKVQQLKNGKPFVNELIFENGSRIIFFTHDQEELIYESIEISWSVFDEPCPRHVWIGLSRGQRTKGSKPWSLMVGTPIAAAWVRQELYEPWIAGSRPDVEFFRGTTQENQENLATGYVEQFSRLLTEDEKRIRLQGEFFDLGGLALAHLFKDNVHQVEPFNIPRDWPVVVSIDCHPSKAHVALALLVDPSTARKYVISELSAKATAAQFAELLLEKFSTKFRVVDWVCDSLGAADTTGGEGFKSFIQVLNDHGIRVRSTSYEEKDDELWIERIRSALEIPQLSDNFGERVPNLRIFDNCDKIIRDIKNVSWLKHKQLNENKTKLDISNKDFLACLKYALAASASFRPGGQQARPVKLGNGTSGGYSVRERYMKNGKNTR